MKKFFCLVFIFLFNHLVLAADLFDGNKPRDYRLADSLDINTTIGGYPIWNGEGK